MDVDSDTHLCLSCHTTIVGLMNYVRHKNNECPITHKESSKKIDATLGVDVSGPVPALVTNTFSPSASRVIEPHVVLTDSHVSDFFASLELQSRATGSHPDDAVKGDGRGKSIPDPGGDSQRPLPIASILDDLGFSSDSDFIPSDDDLLNFEPDEMDPSHPPVTHTGGKWKPGQRPTHPSRGKWASIGKHPHYLSPSSTRSSHDSIHVRSGTLTESQTAEVPDIQTGNIQSDISLPSIREITQISEIPSSSAAQVTDVTSESTLISSDTPLMTLCDTAATVTITTSASQNLGLSSDKTRGAALDGSPESQNYMCKPCGKVLCGKYSYARHVASDLHKRRELGKPAKQKGSGQQCESITCPPCGKTFNNKYNFVRHLLTLYHQRRAKEVAPIELDQTFQLLLLRQMPYQCLVCRYFCVDNTELLTHCGSSEHLEKVKDLVGPLQCVRCQFTTRSGKDMVSHFSQASHIKACTKKHRPCVVKETRHNVQCEHCDLTFHSASHLAQHVQRQHQNGQIKKRPIQGDMRRCHFCDKSFKSVYALVTHVRRKHTKERPFKCDDCHVSFADKYTLAGHLNSARHKQVANKQAKGTNGKADANSAIRDSPKSKKGRIYKCSHCSFKCKAYADLRPHHISTHTDQVYSCNPCGTVYFFKSEYDTHCKSLSHKKRCASAISGTSKPKLNVCNHCGKKFSQSNELEYHKAVGHSKFSSPDGDDKQLMGLSVEHREYFCRVMGDDHNKQSAGEKILVPCPECERQVNIRTLSAHLRFHEGSRPFSCSMCDKSFCSTQTLKRHMKQHFGLSAYSCETCGKVYKKSSSLAEHIATHKRENTKAYTCVVCMKTFLTQNQLKMHARIHAKNYKCTHPGCGKSFVAPSALEYHLRVHSNERPYLCDQCGYAGKTQNQLTRHRSMHTGERNYHCEYCPYKAPNSHNLRRHMRIHIGSKPYHCPHCDYTCNTHENIRKHILTSRKHRGKPVYPCQFCQYGTNSSGEYKSHMQMYHSDQVSPEELESPAVLSGLYRKTSDPRNVAEGQRALPVKEKFMVSEDA